MITDLQRQELSYWMWKVIYALGYVHKVVAEINDEKAMTLVEEMELGALAPMKRLRDHLGIPYREEEKK